MPAKRSSSSRAAGRSVIVNPGMSKVMLKKAFTTATTRVSNGIASPFRPSGYPSPLTHS